MAIPPTSTAPCGYALTRRRPFDCWQLPEANNRVNPGGKLHRPLGFGDDFQADHRFIAFKLWVVFYPHPEKV